VLDIRGGDRLRKLRSGPSPAFYYSPSEVRRRCDLVRLAFPGADLFYSVKANPNRLILDAVVDGGLGFEVGGPDEAEAVRACGDVRGRLVRAGPGKGAAVLRGAVQDRVLAIVCESARELELAAAIKAEAAMGAAESPLLLLRLNLDEPEHVTQFGLDEGALRRLLTSPSAGAVGGIHAYFDAVGVSLERLESQVARLSTRLERALDLGCPLHYLLIGPALGIPYALDEVEFDPEEAGRACAPLIGLARAQRAQTGIELGRFIAGPAGVYVTTVVDVKRCLGTEFLLLDGGWNHLLRPVVTGQRFPLVHLGGAQCPPTSGPGDLKDYRLVGPTCSPLDCLGDYSLPPCRPGDRLAVLQTGAYGRTMSPGLFMGCPPAVELSLDSLGGGDSRA